MLKEFALKFGVDIDSLVPQVATCRIMIRKLVEEQDPDATDLKSVFDFYLFLYPYQQAFFAIFELVKIACSLPMSRVREKLQSDEATQDVVEKFHDA